MSILGFKNFSEIEYWESEESNREFFLEIQEKEAEERKLLEKIRKEKNESVCE